MSFGYGFPTEPCTVPGILLPPSLQRIRVTVAAFRNAIPQASYLGLNPNFAEGRGIGYIRNETLAITSLRMPASHRAVP